MLINRIKSIVLICAAILIAACAVAESEQENCVPGENVPLSKGKVLVRCTYLGQKVPNLLISEEFSRFGHSVREISFFDEGEHIFFNRNSTLVCLREACDSQSDYMYFSPGDWDILKIFISSIAEIEGEINKNESDECNFQIEEITEARVKLNTGEFEAMIFYSGNRDKECLSKVRIGL